MNKISSKTLYVSEEVYAELLEANLRESGLSTRYDGRGMLGVCEKYLPREEVLELKEVFTPITVVKGLNYPMLRKEPR